MGEQLLRSNQELFEEASALSDMLEMMEAATETASRSRKAKLQGPHSALVNSGLPPHVFMVVRAGRESATSRIACASGVQGQAAVYGE